MLPWATWLDRLPSLRGLNRKDVRTVAAEAAGDFRHASGFTSYVSSIELFRLRQKLRAQAKLKKQLFRLRSELTQKTQGWTLDESGAVRARNAPGPNIEAEIARITTTLRVFEERSVNLEKALREMHTRR